MGLTYVELADGSHMRRDVGLALFRIGRKRGGSEVVFGGPRDEPLLGAVTLEALGLELCAGSRPSRALLERLVEAYRKNTIRQSPARV